MLQYPTTMTRREFEKQVEVALKRIPKKFREAMDNIAIVIRDTPGPEAEGMESEEEAGPLYGLFHGIPLPERTIDDSGTQPDSIYIYQNSLQKDFPDKDELIREIEITVIHEIAHYFGLGEADLERYGYD
jgi:predicted Zn-dependent protease with MMP-like domain